MGMISKVLRLAADSNGHRQLLYWCPGCEGAHGVAIDAPNNQGAKWTWNNNRDKPTFSPSVHANAGHADPRFDQCHHFVVDGNIQFLGDCTHALAGQTVPMEGWN